MRGRVLAGLLAVGAGSRLVACGGNAFACSNDSQCLQDGAAGMCHDPGYCSFPDEACESEQRYGSHAGDGLAGQCVPVPGDTEPTASTTSATPGSTSDPTLSTSTSSDTTSSSTSLPLDATGSSSTTEPGTTGEPMGSSSGSSTTGTPIDPDILLWYRFDDPLDDGPEDSSDSNLHGSCTACPSSAPGHFGSAAAFDGSTQFIDLPVDPALDLTEPFTVSLWIYKESWATGTEHITGRAYGMANFNSWEIFTFTSDTSTTLRLTMFDTNGDGAFQSVVVPQVTDQWIHLALVWNGTTGRVYVDAQQALEVSPDGIAYDAQHVSRIGADVDQNENNNFFEGRIDDYRIYTRALTPDELIELAAR